MDRAEFTKSISNNDEEELKILIMKYFDEVMLLYNLFGDLNNIKIKRTDSDSIATFSILFRTKKESNKMCKLVDNMRINLYSNNYMIHSSSSGKTVHIDINYK